MKRPRIGILDKRVELQAPTKTQDARGEYTEEYCTVGRAWAGFRALAGRDLLEAQQIHAEVTHEVTIRFRPDITEQWRIRRGSRTFHIRGAPIDPDESRRWLMLTVVERIEEPACAV